MVDATQPTESPQAAAQPLLAPSMNDAPAASSDVPAATYDNSPPQTQVASDVAAEPAQAPAQPKQPLSYQDQITKLQKAGFSGDEIQNYSINQAVKLRQAGFSQDEVDAYQGMKPPSPGTPPIYGRVPTDEDFQNAATAILHGNDHPWYQSVLDKLTGLHAATGVTPEEAVKATQTIPQFQDIMDQASGSYIQEASRTILSGLAASERGLGTLQAFSASDKPLFDVGFGTGKDPEQYYLYQKGVAFQKWIDENAPAQPQLEAEHPYKTGAVNFAAQLPDILATLGTSMVAGGAEDARASAREQGASIEKATDYAGKVGMLWAPLGLTDAGVFFKTVERSAPGALPWIVAKGNQFLRNGAVLTGTNELGDKLSSEIAQTSGIPIQYKPTLQRIVTEFLGGGLMGTLHPTGIKRGEKVNAEPPSGGTQPPSEEPPGGAATSPQNDMGYKGEVPHITVRPEGEPVQQPNAPVSKYTPAYHFDTDSYGIKNDKGEFVQTGYGSEEEANHAANEMAKPVEQEKAEIPPEVVDRYKQTIADEAEKAGINLTSEQIEQGAKVIAEQHNPPEAEKPRPLAEVQKEVPKQNAVAVETAPKPVEVASKPVENEPPAAAANIEPPQSVFTSLAPTKKLQYDHLTAARKAMVAQGIDASRMRIADRQLTIDNPTHAESMHIRDAVQAQHDKYLKNSATGKANYQNRINNAAAKDPTTFKNFLTYLADHKGIKDDGGKEKISNLGLGKDVPVGLVRSDGMSHQEALEKAIEDGWIPNKDNPDGKNENDLGDLYDLIRDRGKQPHPEADAKQVSAQDRSDNLRLEMDKRGLHYDEKTTDEDAEKVLNAHKSLEKLGINADGMSMKQMHDAMDMRSAEVTDENEALNDIRNRYPELENDYYPDMEEPYDEASFEGAHTGHEPEVGAGDERPEAGSESAAGVRETEPINAGVAGRGAESAGADAGRAGADDRAATTFEPAKNVAGATEQGVLGGMEQSAKQAMAARGEKIGAKVEQKPANEGLFGDKEEDRGEFLFQKADGETKELPPQSQELLERVKDIIKRIAPDATVEFVKGDGTAHGFYDRAKKIITIALSSPDQIATGSHEAFHAVWDLLTDAEKKTIIDDANNKGLMEKYGIKEKYAEQPENHDQEMAAHWFGDWMSDKEANNASSDTRTIFQKVKDILSGIADKIRGVFGQDATADDVFKKIESGDVGKREGGTSGEGLLFQKSDKDKPTLGEAIKGIRDTFSPTSAGNGAKNTEVVLRESYGQAKRDQAIAETALNEFARQANEMTPAEHEDFYNYVEGRSVGAQLKNKQFQRMADAIRNIYANYKDALQKMPETRMMNFVQDYFTHQWAKGQDAKIKEFMNNWWQQGSSRNLKERKIPTIADGLAYGLQLEEPNPVRAVSRYVGSMSHYMASVNVLRAINTELGGAFYADGRQPEGYAPLVGRNAERIENARVDEESGKLVPARNLHLYAPKEVADLYNAFYSKGFEDTKLGSAYMMVRNAINTNTMLELGLSAYHFSTINVQSFNQDVGRILRNALSGDWAGVGQAIKGLVTPGLHFIQGSKLMEQYKDLKDHGIDMERIANLFASANMRLGQDPLRNISNHGGFYKSWQRGELPGLVDRLKQQATEGYGLGLLKSGAEVVGKVVSDVSHPLFNVYVPAIKMSAFHDLMGDWMRQNPGASDGEISVNALRIGNMVEDRFGEMNMENIFWNQKAKELLGLTFRAPGWDIGLVRQVGGAGKDVYQILRDAAGGKKFNSGNLDRPLFMVGAVMSYVAMNAAMTYVKTGVMPSDQKMKDWIAYATGGVHKAFGWHPEQAELPGHGRELIQLSPNPGQGPLSGVTQEVSNKVATLPKKIYEAANNRDWNGKPIYNPKSNSWMQRTPGVAQFAHVASGFEPFSMEQLFEGQQPGSKLSLAERFMGVRAAGAKITAPEELKAFNEKHH